MCRLLFVDDNLPLAENLAEILRDEGEDAIAVSDGATALRVLRDTGFDVLITDMAMPLMDGAELIRAIHEVQPNLPAIVMTAYSTALDLQRLAANRPVAVLPKPVPMPRLLQLVAESCRIEH